MRGRRRERSTSTRSSSAELNSVWAHRREQMKACARTPAGVHIHTVRTCEMLLQAPCKQLEWRKEPFGESSGSKHVSSFVRYPEMHQGMLLVLNNSGLIPRAKCKPWCLLIWQEPYFLKKSEESLPEFLSRWDQTANSNFGNTESLNVTGKLQHASKAEVTKKY